MPADNPPLALPSPNRAIEGEVCYGTPRGFIGFSVGSANVAEQLRILADMLDKGVVGGIITNIEVATMPWMKFVVEIGPPL